MSLKPVYQKYSCNYKNVKTIRQQNDTVRTYIALQSRLVSVKMYTIK